MARARIIGTGSYAPEKILTNDDLSKLIETNDEWIRTRTGIRERHIAREDEQTSDMAVEAAKRALEMAGKTAADLDLIIVGTISGDMPMPSCASFVQAKLGAKAPAFDVSAACAGSIYGLAIADKFVRTGAAKCALVIGVELLSRILDWEDRNTCVLFGDAAGAMIVGPEPDEEKGILSTHLHTDGNLTDILKIPGGGSIFPVTHEVVDQRMQFVKMNGREVYKVAVRSLTDVVNEALAHNNLTTADVDHVVPHQANIRIVDTVLERLAIPKEKAILNIDRFGNTSSASVPITLDEGVRTGRIKSGDLVAMMAIGAGMTWGGALVRW
ncbi:MAG: ketoacyl-ACP synthase III [Myxococcales bacterium]|nr:ketoacyl-ACP synthase III [Myxococcales bacterium]MCB9651031.1 ketoacyl-ACP synthase III [Deltaproteobacteria bacterium]